MLSVAVLVAFLGGVLPALLWLFFWLMEDRVAPEPKRYIFFCFIAGMAITYLAIDSERFIAPILEPGYDPLHPGPAILFAWASIEEIMKFGAAYIAALYWKVFDEPLDAVVYMITAALGFSAAENALFLFSFLQRGDFLQTVLTGDLRFIGATLLHTLSSATIGIALAITYYRSANIRRLAALIGVILAASLHTLFNFFILKTGNSATLWVFLCIWFGIVGILLILERIKRPILAKR